MANYKVSYNKDVSNSYTYDKSAFLDSMRKEKENIVVCRHCSWRMLKVEGKEPAICESCHHDPISGEELDKSKFFHNEIGDDSVKPATHIQVKWTCKACGHFGIRWVHKKEKTKKFECPECGFSDLRRRSIPPIGRRKSLWENSVPVQRSVPTFNAIRCNSCGNLMQFRYARPRICVNCQSEFPPEDQE